MDNIVDGVGSMAKDIFVSKQTKLKVKLVEGSRSIYTEVRKKRNKSVKETVAWNLKNFS